MTEQEALGMSNGHIDYRGYIGYLPFEASNFLVGTGNYFYQQSTCWGYVVGKKGIATFGESDGR